MQYLSGPLGQSSLMSQTKGPGSIISNRHFPSPQHACLSTPWTIGDICDQVGSCFGASVSLSLKVIGNCTEGNAAKLQP